MIIYDNGEVKVEVEESACITIMGSKPIYITLSELTGIAGAVAKHLKKEAELEYEKFAWPPTGEV